MQLIGTILFWLTWPLNWFYLSRGERSRPLVIAEDHILLVKNFISPNRWALPGGGIHNQENPTVGAARELREETGIEIKPEDFKLLYREKARQYGLHYRYSCYLVQLPKMQSLRKRSLELTGIAWVAIEDLPKYRLLPDAQAAVQAWSKL